MYNSIYAGMHVGCSKLVTVRIRVWAMGVQQQLTLALLCCGRTTALADGHLLWVHNIIYAGADRT